jgi:nitrous oxidase accessory protein NosD
MKTLPLAISTAALLLLANSANAGNIQVPQDFPTIQEAVDAALDADVILVGPGIYRENVVIITSGITLKGPKAIIDGAYLGNCIDVTADDVTITGFDLVNGGLPAAPGDIGTGGCLSYTGSGADITKLEISGGADFGIMLTGTGRIEDCLVAACLGTGMLLDSGDQAGPQTLLKVNEVYRCGTGILADDGPFTFDRNIVSNNSGDGIHVTVLAAAGDGTVTTTTGFSKNKITGNGGAGLLIEDEVGQVTLIDKNDLILNGVGLDIIGAGVQVSSNEIDMNRAGGAFLKTTDATFDKNKVRRNTLVGVVVSAPEGVTDGTNTLTNNKVEANGGDGMQVASGANVVDDNLFNNNKGDGIQVLTGVAATTINDNTLKENRHDGIDNWGTETLITDNVSKDNVGADLAGVGDGAGTVNAASTGNLADDGTDLTSVQELELDTLTPAP